MNLLILGGTIFLGRSLVETALTRKHTVTLFNRGKHNPDLFPEVEKIQGDRRNPDDLKALTERTFDAVIDTCGYIPREVAASANLLADKASLYCFISSISVYNDLSEPGRDETASVGVLADPSVEEVTGESYGPLKVLCEQAAEQAFPGRTLVIRPGLIVGPHDPSDRFTYWPHRVAKGGAVLAPGNPDLPTQFIDVRDLAEWTIRLVERKMTGVFNATGPDYPLTMGELLETCQTVSGSDASFTYVAEDFLQEQGVQPWMELPLWVPASDGGEGFNAVSVEKALKSGLSIRPLSETVHDTLFWSLGRSQDNTFRHALKPEKEAAVLAAWEARSL